MIVVKNNYKLGFKKKTILSRDLKPNPSLSSWVIIFSFCESEGEAKAKFFSEPY